MSEERPTTHYIVSVTVELGIGADDPATALAKAKDMVMASSLTNGVGSVHVPHSGLWVVRSDVIDWDKHDKMQAWYAQHKHLLAEPDGCIPPVPPEYFY